MTARRGRGVAMGESLVLELDRLAAVRGTSRSAQAVRLIWAAFTAPKPAPAQADHYLYDDCRAQGRVTLWAPDDLWGAVESRAVRLTESVSESVRALIHGGLAVESTRCDPTPNKHPRDTALKLIRDKGPLGTAAVMLALGKHRKRHGHVGLLLRLERQGLIRWTPPARKYDSGLWEAVPIFEET